MDKVIQSVSSIVRNLRRRISSLHDTVDEALAEVGNFEKKVSWIRTYGESYEQEWLPLRTTNEAGFVSYSISSVDMSRISAGQRVNIYINGKKFEETIKYIDAFGGSHYVGNLGVFLSGTASSANVFGILMDLSENSVAFRVNPKGEYVVEAYVVLDCDDNAYTPLPAKYIPRDTASTEYVNQQIFNRSQVDSYVHRGTITLPDTHDWIDVAYGNNTFVAISSAGVIAHSFDGIKWSLSRDMYNSPAFAGSYSSVCYGNGMFLIVASGSSNLWRSDDGILWRMTSGVLPWTNWAESRMWSKVFYGNGKFIAFDSASLSFAYSYNGDEWFEGVMPCVAEWKDVTYCRGIYFAIAPNAAAYSMDGINWKPFDVQENGAHAVLGIDKSNEIIFVSSASNTLYCMTNLGVSVHPAYVFADTYSFIDMAWDSNDTIVFLDMSGKIVRHKITNNMISGNFNAESLLEVALPYSYEWISVAYGCGKFIAISKSPGVVAFSEDGTNWSCEYTGVVHHGNLMPDVATKEYVTDDFLDLELIETIVCDGTFSTIVRNNLSLKRLVVYIHTQPASAPLSGATEVYNGDGMFGYAWMGNCINTGERWVYINAVSGDRKTAYLESTSASTAKYGSGNVARTSAYHDGTSPINKFVTYISGGGSFTAGTEITIWGVRADA